MGLSRVLPADDIIELAARVGCVGDDTLRIEWDACVSRGVTSLRQQWHGLINVMDVARADVYRDGQLVLRVCQNVHLVARRVLPQARTRRDGLE